MRTRNDPEVMTLAGAAECDPRTVVRVLDGETVKPLVRMRIERAAKRLGIKLPERKETT